MTVDLASFGFLQDARPTVELLAGTWAAGRDGEGGRQWVAQPSFLVVVAAGQAGVMID